MDDWVVRAMQRWPNVPALFGWLSLDRRGRWLIRGEVITHPRIIEVINRNYAADERGKWFFQNGPQRGYMQLEYAPFLIRIAPDDVWSTHTGLQIQRPAGAFVDEDGTLVLQTEHGPGEVAGSDLQLALQHLTQAGRAIDERQVVEMLALPSGATTRVVLEIAGSKLPVMRLDAAVLPSQLGFVRDPQP